MISFLPFSMSPHEDCNQLNSFFLDYFLWLLRVSVAKSLKFLSLSLSLKLSFLSKSSLDFLESSLCFILSRFLTGGCFQFSISRFRP